MAVECDTSYLNTVPGRIKVTCLILCIIENVAAKIGATYFAEIEKIIYVVSDAFLITAILLLLFICVPSFRNSSLWLKIEIVICAILAITYIFGTIEAFTFAWRYTFNNFKVLQCIFSLITLIACVFSLLTFAYDASLKYKDLRENSPGSISAV